MNFYFLSRFSLGRVLVSIVLVLIQVVSITVAQVDSDTIVVELRSAYVNSEELRIVCDVNGVVSIQQRVHLLCPLSVNELCYSNCSDIASLSSVITHCDYNAPTPNQMQLTYTINPTKVFETGSWYCTYRGVKSQPISLSKPAITSTTPKPTTTTTETTTQSTTTTVIKSQTKKPNSPQQPPVQPPYPPDNKIITSPAIPPSSDREKYRNNHDEWTPISKPEVILGLLSILLVSILINVGFCIRCVLVKSYIDKIRRGEQSQRCLERCLCLNPDPRRRFWKMIYRRRFGSKSGKHEGIYEEMPDSSSHRATALQSNNMAMGYVRRPSLQRELNEAAMLMPMSTAGTPIGTNYHGLTPTGHPQYNTNSIPTMIYYPCSTFPRHHLNGTPSTLLGTNMPGVSELSERGDFSAFLPHVVASSSSSHTPNSHPHLPHSLMPHSHLQSHHLQQVVYDDVPMDVRSTSSTGALYIPIHPSSQTQLPIVTGAAAVAVGGPIQSTAAGGSIHSQPTMFSSSMTNSQNSLTQWIAAGNGVGGTIINGNGGGSAGAGGGGNNNNAGNYRPMQQSYHQGNGTLHENEMPSDQLDLSTSNTFSPYPPISSSAHVQQTKMNKEEE